MRLSELGEKEIINVSNGCRYGDLSSAELLFEEKTAKIRAFLIPENKNKLFFMGGHDFIQMPWESIKKIGEDIIIVETEL